MKDSIYQWLLFIVLIIGLSYGASLADSYINRELEQEPTLFYFTISDSSMTVYDSDDNHIGSTSLPKNLDSLLVDYYE
jgi:hypothetical protein